MDAKLSSKTQLDNTFFNFLSRFVLVWLKILQKCEYDTQNMFSKSFQYGCKKEEFDANLESV
jgi:hypothetical protein